MVTTGNYNTDQSLQKQTLAQKNKWSNHRTEQTNITNNMFISLLTTQKKHEFTKPKTNLHHRSEHPYPSPRKIERGTDSQPKN
jgi:hypothetical protein